MDQFGRSITGAGWWALAVLALSACGGGGDPGGTPAAGPAGGSSAGAGGASSSAGGTSSAGAEGGATAAGGAASGGGNDGPPSVCARIGDEIKIAPGGTSFALLFDAGHYVFAYTDPSSGSGDVMVTTLDATGAPSGAVALVENTPDPSGNISLAKTNSGYVLAWQDITAAMTPIVHVHALDANAQPVGTGYTFPPSAGTEARPIVSNSPVGVVLAWMDVVNGVQSAFVAALDDTTLAPKGTPTSLGTPAGASHPWVTGDASSLAIIWSDHRAGQYDEYFSKVDPKMDLAGAASLRMGATNDALLGRMVKTNSGYLAAWEDARTGSEQIMGALTDGGGMIDWSGVVEDGSGDANWPHMAWNGTDGAVVYYQSREDGRFQIYLTLIDDMGTRVAGGGDLQVSSTPSPGKARFPDVVWTGSDFGVAWIDSRSGGDARDVYFSRVGCN